MKYERRYPGLDRFDAVLLVNPPNVGREDSSALGYVVTETMSKMSKVPIQGCPLGPRFRFSELFAQNLKQASSLAETGTAKKEELTSTSMLENLSWSKR